MSLEETLKVNYHAYLNEIKGVMDPVIKKMREQNGQPWRGQAWLGPVKELGRNAKQLKLIKSIEWASLPFIGPLLVGIAAGKYSSISLSFIILGSILLAAAAYIGLVKWYEGKMATISNPRFHVEAFKSKRPSEYLVWSQFVTKNDFTFDGLSEFVNLAFYKHGDSGHIDRIVQFTSGQLEVMQQSIESLSQTIEEQEQAILSLEEEIDLSENAVGYLVGLMNKITENLYRLHNNRLELHDMDFVTGFSLYQQEGEQLKLILDKGTSGISPTYLDLQDKTLNYVAVDAANSDTELKAFMHNPYPGRYVIAFRMTMSAGQTWVWCFHFNEDDERALSLTLAGDIIESRQIRRLIHAFCLILQKRLLSLEEVDKYAANE